MDTFFEQIVSIKKSGKAVLAVIGIWLLAIILTALLIIFNPIPVFNIILIFGIMYGAFWLSTRFNVEYEYIITNGTLDIDKIINKSSRKRILSFELGGVSRLEKYNPSMLNSINGKDVTFACNPGDENAYLLVAEKEGKPSSYLVFAPEERLQTAVKKFVPKYIANSAFK